MFSKVKIASAAALLTLSVGAQANVVDLFTDPAAGQSVSTAGLAVGASVFNEVGSFGSIIGGYRSLEIVETADSSALPLNALNSASMLAGGGQLAFASAPAVTAQGIVQWDGGDNSSTLDMDGMGSQDLVNQVGCPAGGCDRFIFDVLSNDLGFNFTIGIYTDDDNWTEFDLVSVTGTHVSEIFFSFFENAAGCGLVAPALPVGVLAQRCGGIGGNQVADVENVGAIQLIFNLAPGTVDLDFRIGAVTKTGIPEPSMVALLGLGLASSGLVSIRRRRKEKALLAA